jgi:hypothetical protein
MKPLLIAVSFAVAMSFLSVGRAQTEAPSADPPADTEASTDEVSLSYAEPNIPPEKPRTWQDRKWNFVLAPYLIFPFMNGSMTFPNPLPNQSQGPTASFELNPGDIFKMLRGFLTLYFEAAHPKFSLATDILYMNLGKGAQLPVGDRSADLRMQQLATELVVFGRIADWFEFGGGGRVNFVQAFLSAPAGMVLPALEADFRKTWFDPLIAVRFSVPFKNDHWHLGVRADVGGFTLGSQYAWQVYPYGGYNFDGVKDKRVFELGAAFRAFGMKYELGDGPNRLVYDMIIWGPELGFIFHL